MKPMTCGKCHQQFTNHEVKDRKFNYYGYDMRGPRCRSWLSPDGRSVKLRMLGVVLWLAGLATVYFQQAGSNFVVLTAGFFSLVGMALFAASYKASQLVEKKT